MMPDIFNSPAALRMGWALLHCLWQGTWMALALKGALLLIPQSYSRLRYALALSCLFLMAALPVLLLSKPDNSKFEVPAAYEIEQFEPFSATGLTSAPTPIHPKPDYRHNFSNYLVPLVPWISAVWILGAALLLLKTVGGVIKVRILRQAAAAHCETKGAASFHLLAARARVTDVPILESGLVSIPTVAGWFRPVVLLPKGVFEAIDRSMLDALVAHELAHIRRHDSVMNLFQTVIENLLFFHPAVWWVTKCVRAEREACCDDDAVAICGDRLVYARALSRAEHFRSSMPVVALSSSPLLQRIRRLTDMRISKMNHVTVLCMALLAACFIIVTAAGSVLLATIPPLNTESNVSAGIQRGDRDARQANLEAQKTQLQAAGRYRLVCGIVGGKADPTTGKITFSPPPQSDGTPNPGGCLLMDLSTPKFSQVSGELQPSRLVHKSDPIYPEAAIRNHVGIRVVLHISVNEEGLVTDAEVTKSQTVPPDRDSEGNWVGGVRADIIKGINKAAINAVKQWKYSPTLLDGKAIPVMATVSMDFTYNKDGLPKIITYAP